MRILEMSRKIGYARVSKLEQDLTLQVDALIQEGCQKGDIFVDKISGAKADRPGLTVCMEKIRTGDTLVVWRLDRLGRSLSHLVKIVESLKEKKIGFKSLCDGEIDTTSASGELMFNIFSSLSQFERRLVQERTRAGLESARARGRIGGRKPMNPYDPKVLAAQKMHQEKTLEIGEICDRLDISKATFYRYLNLGN